MEQELEQVIQAINIASDPTQAALHQQALDYLGNIQQNAENTWRLALPLFVDATADGIRKYPPQVRFFALRVLDEFFDNRFEPLDDESFRTIQQSLVAYIQSEYIYGVAEANSAFLRNKFSHTLTLFFLCTYMTQWPAFFSDLFSLVRPAQSSSSSSQPAFNRHIILLFFHIVLEISGEVADQMLKSARPFSQERHTRDARVRDAVRERDAAGINEAVLTIVAEGTEMIKKGGANPRESVEVVDLGIRTFASYVGWIDINLTVTPTTVPLLFSLLADPSLPIRLATCLSLSRIVAKGLKEPGDKLQLLKVLSLGQVLDALESKTRADQTERSETDEGEESYREALGKLLNTLGLELLKLAEDSTSEDVTSEASSLLAQILPVLLRFMADEYDDTCTTIFPMLQTILTGYKRSRKASSDPIDDSKRSFLNSLLQVILAKMKWDEETDLEDSDEDDIAEFENLRKELRVLMDSVTVVDQDLVTDAVRSFALNTIGAFQNGMSVKWNDAELGVYLVNVFGEINKAGSKGRAAFCQAPAIDKDKRKAIDYSQYPLTPHGEMIFALVQSNISSYPHRSVMLQFFETASRYTDFFKVRNGCIMPTLEAMVDTRGLHNTDASYRSRVSYLFSRFIKDLRADIPVDVVVNIATSLRDLLAIEVQLGDAEDSDSSSSDILSDAIKSSAFDSQLYLYETIGTLCSLLFNTPVELATLLMSFVKPLMSELSDNLQAYRTKGSQDLIPIIKVHHVVMALGNIAKGFPDYPSPVPPEYIPLPVDVFAQVAQAILVCLEEMNVFKDVRDASRFAFARILATTGPSVAHVIPQLMASLLTQFEPSELVDFLNFIGLLIHKLQTDIFSVLDELIGPLSSHITGLLTQPISGTDDQRVHVETKKAYLGLLNNILASKLQGIFISERNRGGFDSLMEAMLGIAGDISDPPSEKAALVFLSRAIAIWGQPAMSASSGNGLPGFERYIYERIVVTVFRIPSLPEFNLKDPGLTPVLHEIANLLQCIFKIRGTEAYDYFLSVFLPSQGWPSETAIDFTTKLRDLEGKAFRKYFTDFVRSSRSEA
ncbi:armadillo-type protein [Mycena belliarum]|uniref:Exportin-T n=1 Tax=Mycena belliarum TaxID=1033014 RepID=A0AAD6UIH2_9AGAR|nr:armadillo-type protein [Mycena belliae]